MTVKVASIAALFIVSLAGCGLFSSDNTRVPSELPKIASTLKLNALWERSAGRGIADKYIRLTPLLLSDAVIVTDAKGHLEGFVLEDGASLWESSVDADVSAGVNGGLGVAVIGTEDGDVIALGTEDGQEWWRRRLSSEVMALSREELGVVVARTNDSKVYALDSGSGKVLWQTGRTAPVLTLRGVSTPVIAGGKVVVGFDDGKLVAISLTRGNVLWQTTVDAPEGRSELERMVDIDGAIRVSEGIIYVAGFHGRVAAVTLSDGRILWARDFSSHVGLDLDTSHIYVTDDESHVWALDRRTGASLWKQDKLKYRKVTAPAVMDGYVIVGDYQGYIHWLAKADGHLVARTRVDSDGVLAQPVVKDSRAYVLGNGGEIAVLEIVLAETGS